MANVRLQTLAVLCLVISFLSAATHAQTGLDKVPKGMRANFYNVSCPRAESIVKAQVRTAFNSDKTIPAALIRMLFHDCFVRGCDASVLIDNSDSEKLGTPNANSLRGFEVLNAAKAALEQACPRTVSCADVIAFAGRDAVELAGNIVVTNWLGGRRDGSLSRSADTLTELPAPFDNFNTLKAAFSKKGLNQNDLVTLSGAHTIGRARCGIISQRIWNFNGTGRADPAIDPSYVTTLRGLCPQNAPGNRLNMEMSTPTVLDVNYYRDVNNRRGLFESDNSLRTGPGAKLVAQFNQNPGTFTPAFVNSMRRMANIGVLTGKNGKIRTVCNVA
ncbi:hypothetical protein R1sor_026247 [Riccia sorocarpa]|uniref:Peroxidase n=1 Tax=Riccia sorocarpa TaxID=122646 RepID=A0ABD3GEW3_9MARC